MKKFIAFILFCVIVMSTVISISANEQTTNTFNYDEIGVEIKFEEGNSLSQDQKEAIADILAYDLTPIESRAWCWLTGHDKVIHTVTKITHKFTQYAPRCLEDIYNITTCNNCNYYDEQLVAQGYIFCCPEE